MRLVQWDPFRQLLARTEDSFGAWVPPVDIFERQDHLVIRAELPGVSRDDMDVRIENGVLTLQGERKREAELTEDNAFRLERSYGTFTRSFTLPETVDAASVAATYRDGVLEVSVPRIETAKPKKIEIRAA